MPIFRDPAADPVARARAFGEFLVWVGINLVGLWLAVVLIDGVHLAGRTFDLVNIAALFAFVNRLAPKLLNLTQLRGSLVARSASLFAVNGALFLMLGTIRPEGFPMVVRGVAPAILAGAVLSLVALVLSFALTRARVTRRPL